MINHDFNEVIKVDVIVVKVWNWVCAWLGLVVGNTDFTLIIQNLPGAASLSRLLTGPY